MHTDFMICQKTTNFNKVILLHPIKLKKKKIVKYKLIQIDLLVLKKNDCNLLIDI